MASNQIKYDASVTSITCTLASLANGSSRESAAVDNTTNLFDDAAVYLAIKLATGSPGSDKCINVYVSASVDGTNWSDPATGADAAITLRSPTNLRPLAVINTPDSGALTYKFNIASVAQAFGGILPPKWNLVIENRTGLAFDATGGNFTVQYRGITYTTT